VRVRCVVNVYVYIFLDLKRITVYGTSLDLQCTRLAVVRATHVYFGSDFRYLFLFFHPTLVTRRTPRQTQLVLAVLAYDRSGVSHELHGQRVRRTTTGRSDPAQTATKAHVTGRRRVGRDYIDDRDGSEGYRAGE
jgi:hypothetical protein